MVKKPKKCKSCGKLRFATQGQAVAWILHETSQGGPPLNIYRCHAAPWFHVTSRQWRKQTGAQK